MLWKRKKGFYRKHEAAARMLTLPGCNPDIVAIIALGAAAFSGCIDGFKRRLGTQKGPVRDPEFAHDVAVSGQHHHVCALQVARDGFGHGVLPYALGHVKIFEVGLDHAMVAVKYCQRVGPVVGIGQVDVFRQVLFVGIEQVVDTADPHPGWNIGRQIKSHQPDPVFLYKQENVLI